MHRKTEIARPVFVVSACLMGLNSRYDGRIRASIPCKSFLQDSIWIPVCPEQLGGLATPRPAADIINGDGHDVLSGCAVVCTRNGADLSVPFVLGARQVLAIATDQAVSGACLKARSPSCAVSGTTGVTAALLQAHGIPLYEF